jgi:hypothetical protein
MPTTFQEIASVTVGSGGASSIDFTSIPSTYTDIVIKLSCRIGSSADRDGVLLTFNNNTSGYSFARMYGYDSGLSGTDNASSQSSIAVGNTTANNATSNTFGNHEIYVTNYAGSTLKSMSAEAIAENNSTSSWQATMTAGLWSNTAAINRVTLTPGSSSFIQNSTAILYGIKNS